MINIQKYHNLNKLNTIKSKHDKAENIVKDTEEKLKNEVFKEYLDEANRNELIKDAQDSHYSKSRLQNIKEVFEDYNEDNISFNVASDILDAMQHVYEYKRENFLSKISNIIPEDNDSNNNVS